MFDHFSPFQPFQSEAGAMEVGPFSGPCYIRSTGLHHGIPWHPAHFLLRHMPVDGAAWAAAITGPAGRRRRMSEQAGYVVLDSLSLK